MLFNISIAILVSLFTRDRDDEARRQEFHDVLRRYATLNGSKRRWIKPAWILTILWFLFAVGPGAVLGNSLFGDPNEPASWWFGIPSLWTWQILAWLSGVGLMWLLAFHLELATVSTAGRNTNNGVNTINQPD